MSDELLVDRVGGVVTLTLNRPDTMNAFSSEMGQALEAAYRECDADDGVRAVVITGSGRAFCAGADFSGGADVFDAPTDRPAFRSDPFDFHAWDVRKPVIAAINGHAVGLGLTLALQTDIRIVAEDAKLGIVQNRRGVMPDLRSHWTLVRAVGHAVAADILLTGRMFLGAEAVSLGVASRSLPADEVLPTALEIAHDIAMNTAPVSVALSKAILWTDPAPSGADVDALEREGHRHLMGGPDATEGVMAFLERRDPQWTWTVPNDLP